MDRARLTSIRLRGARSAIAALLFAGLVCGVAGHHDPLESAAHDGGSDFLVATAAVHGGSAAHFEASETERHQACVTCLLQRQTGFAPGAGQTLATHLACGRTPRLARFFALANRPAGVDRGRAPPLA